MFIVIVVILQFIGGILGFAFWPEVGLVLHSGLSFNISLSAYLIEMCDATQAMSPMCHMITVPTLSI